MPSSCSRTGGPMVLADGACTVGIQPTVALPASIGPQMLLTRRLHPLHPEHPSPTPGCSLSNLHAVVPAQLLRFRPNGQWCSPMQAWGSHRDARRLGPLAPWCISEAACLAVPGPREEGSLHLSSWYLHLSCVLSQRVLFLFVFPLYFLISYVSIRVSRPVFSL